MDTTIGLVGRLVLGADAWSGIPEGLSRGLRVNGFETVRVSAEPRGRPERVVQGWLRRTGRWGESWAQSAEMMLLRSATVRLRLRRVADVRHWVVMGSEFGSRGFGTYVTYDDMTVAAACRLAGFPYVRPAVRDAWVRRQRRLYQNAEACCAASRWHARSIHDDYGVPESKIHVVGFGANVAVHAAERDWSSPRYLFVGNDWGRKNGEAVLDAFAEVHARIPTATLDLVGDHPRITRPGVAHHGPLTLSRPADRAQLSALFAQATCFVMPSEFEPFGIAYVEAGAAGVPSIATTVGGTADAVGPGGRFVEPGDHAALREAMLELADGDTARELGRHAMVHAHSLTWARVAARVAVALGLCRGEPDLPR